MEPATILQRGSRPRSHNHSRAGQPDAGTDLTATVTACEGQVGLFAAVDHAAGECVGFRTATSCIPFEALEPIRKGVRDTCGGFAEGVAVGLALRHDHGSQYLPGDFQAELRFLCITSSPAFVREPEGTGRAKRFIHTLKGKPLWVRIFETVEELRQAPPEFEWLDNEHWILERLGYLTPARAQQDACSAVEATACLPTAGCPRNRRRYTAMLWLSSFRSLFSFLAGGCPHRS